MENTLAQLRHHVRSLPNNGMVLLLDTGAQITPESEAMLQALYSRDPQSVYAHLRAIAEKGPEKFMANFYVGYGHKSIGDCGTVTLFIEGVSMLVAKAIQDWMLYAGQEVSTRYVDYSSQRFENPLDTEASSLVLENLRSFYLHALPILEANLRELFPKVGDEKDSIYDKAIKARAFDTLRGFLPAGATTSVAWHTNLRQAADKMSLLRHHPLNEVRIVAEALEAVLFEGYPSSFGHKRYDATETYNDAWMMKHYYLHDDACPDFALKHDNIAYAELAGNAAFKEMFATRPQKTELPKLLSELGTMQFRFLLDYGSFRDIQRQRAVGQRMPILNFIHGFEKWYLTELPTSLRAEAEAVLTKNQIEVKKLRDAGLSEENAQYYVPMGYLCANRLTGDIPALVYLAELRATRFVHPTLQMRAQQIAKTLGDCLGGYGLKVYVDDEVGRFDVRRGAQDIIKKE